MSMGHCNPRLRKQAASTCLLQAGNHVSAFKGPGASVLSTDFRVRVFTVGNLHCVGGTGAPISDKVVRQLCCLSIPQCSIPEALQSHEPHLQGCCLQMAVHRYWESWAQVEAGVLGFLVPLQFPEAVYFHPRHSPQPLLLLAGLAVPCLAGMRAGRALIRLRGSSHPSLSRENSLESSSTPSLTFPEGSTPLVPLLPMDCCLPASRPHIPGGVKDFSC